MTHVNFLLHRLLVSETQTDRQTRQICNRYIHIYIKRNTEIQVVHPTKTTLYESGLS